MFKNPHPSQVSDTHTLDKMDLKMQRMQSKYASLMKSTSRLFERTTRRLKSNKDLERTVKYLRALHNQIAPKPHAYSVIEQEQDYDSLDSDDELLQKTTFMIEEDREYRERKRLQKENEFQIALAEMRNKWNKQRIYLENQKQLAKI